MPPREVSDDALLDAMRRASRELRASELAELIGHVKPETIASRLVAMSARGLVASRAEPGKRPGVRLWSRTTRAILADHPPEPASSAR